MTGRVVGLPEAIEVEVHHCRWLAAAIRKSIPIIVGILVATLVNHAAAGAVDGWVAQALGPDILRWVIGMSFLAMAGWVLTSDKIDKDAAGGKRRFGVFGKTVVAFLLAQGADDVASRPSYRGHALSPG